MKKWIVILCLILGAIAAVIVAVVFFSSPKGTFTKSDDASSYNGLTKESTIADFEERFPNSLKEKSNMYSFQEDNLTRWGFSSGEVRLITGRAFVNTDTNLINSIILSVYPVGVEKWDGVAAYKKMVSYFTDRLGQADEVNELETEYLWTKPESTVALVFSSDVAPGRIDVKYYYNLTQ